MTRRRQAIVIGAFNGILGALSGAWAYAEGGLYRLAVFIFLVVLYSVINYWWVGR